MMCFLKTIDFIQKLYKAQFKGFMPDELIEKAKQYNVKSNAHLKSLDALIKMGISI